MGAAFSFEEASFVDGIINFVTFSSSAQLRWGVYGGLSRSESVEKLQPFNTGPGLDIELESEPIDVAVYSHIGWFIER